MSVSRTIIQGYRTVQYAVCGRSKHGVMRPGEPCRIEPFKEDVNHGDVVHPCVRYIPEGYEGHCWWLVYTPYYGANPNMENPILCYAEDNSPVPPAEWKVYCLVKAQPEKGYNSDPALLYASGQLFVFWREYGTEAVEATGHQVATFCGRVKDGTIVDVFGPVVWSDDLEIDNEVSPAFVQTDDAYLCLAMHLQFHSKWLNRQRGIWKKILTKTLAVADLVGLGSQQKHFGIARWQSDAINRPFQYAGTEKIKNSNALYRPWHLDLFTHQGRLYAIIQTNQCNADLCLAYSDDNKHFTFFDNPLITNATIGKLGIYKPTAGVIGEMFYLYYTAQDENNRKLNKLYLTTMSFSTLLNSMK